MRKDCSQMHSPAFCGSASSINSTDASFLLRRRTPLGRLILFAVAMVILSMFGGNLLAQDAPYNGEYPPSPQSDYADPNYQQPEAYAQQSYQPQEYPQQSYPEPASGQAQPLNAEDLEQLVALIAPYPD